MNELDLLTQFHTDIAEPSAEAWQRARAAIATAAVDCPTARWRMRRIRDAAWRAPRRSLAALAGTAGVAAAATIGALVLTAGTTPAAAQAFPILLTHATNLRDGANSGDSGIPSILGSLHAWLPEATAAAAAGDARAAFSLPDAAGYILASPDGSTLCIVAIAGPDVNAGGITSSGYCDTTTDAEQRGLVLSFGFAAGEQDYAALVPTGGSAELTQNGTTTTLPLVDGIASGTLQGAETLTIQVGDSTRTIPLDSSAPAPLTWRVNTADASGQTVTAPTAP